MHRSMKRLLPVICVLSLPVWQKASFADTPCPLTYETFETAVSHLDAEICPDAKRNETAFCRISVGGDQAHVFYFSKEGKQCLLKVESYDDDDMAIDFKR